MKTILLSFFALATVFLLSSAAPLDKRIDEATKILGLGVPKLDKNNLSKKGKPPGKLPGPKLFQEAKGLEFFSQIPKNMIPKINPLTQDNDQRRKKHLSETERYFAPLHEEPKRAPASLQDANDAVPGMRTLTENQNHMTLRKLEKISAALPVNLDQA